MKARDSFIFYRSFYESIKQLPSEEQAKIYNAIAEYSLNQNEVVLSGVHNAIFILIKPQLEANNRKFKNGCKDKKDKQKISKDKKDKQKISKDKQKISKDKQKISKDEGNVNVNVNVNDNHNENKDISVIPKKNYSEDMINIWNTTCLSLSKATKNVDTRNRKLNSLISNKKLKDEDGNALFESIEDWQSYCDNIHSADKLCGRIDGFNWRADIDWCLKPEKIIKICEGNYDNKREAK